MALAIPRDTSGNILPSASRDNAAISIDRRGLMLPDDEVLANYAIRLANPRNDIWGNTLAEDTPEALEKTVLQPLRQRLAIESGNIGALTPTAPRLFEQGNSIVAVDPRTGQAKVVHTTPEKPPAQPSVSVPIYPPGVDPNTAKMLGVTPTIVRGPLSSVAPMAGTNLPPSLSQGLSAPSANFMNAVEAGKSAVQENVPVGYIGTPGKGNQMFWPGIKESRGGLTAPEETAPVKSGAVKYPTATNQRTGQRVIFKDGKWQSP